MPQKTVSPVPATPKHAEKVASEKMLAEVEEATRRLEKSKSKVLEEEEGMAKVDGELQGVKDQIKAHLKEEEERRRREEGAGGDDTDDSPFAEEAGSSEEVGVRVEVGKRRKVARQGRFSESSLPTSKC